MPKLLIVIIIFFHLHSFSQVADFITVSKKNGVTLKRFFTGSSITLETKRKVFIDGIITKIKNDSVSLLTYNIQIVNTNLGVTKPDTIASKIVKLHYKDIWRIKIFKTSVYPRKDWQDINVWRRRVSCPECGKRSLFRSTGY